MYQNILLNKVYHKPDLPKIFFLYIHEQGFHVSNHQTNKSHLSKVFVGFFVWVLYITTNAVNIN